MLQSLHSLGGSAAYKALTLNYARKKIPVIAVILPLYALSTYTPLHAIAYRCSRVALYQYSERSYARLTDLSPSLSVGLCVRLCVCRKVYCGKMAEWIRMPFGMVSGVG